MATDRLDPESSKIRDVSKAKPKKSKIHLKRVFKRKKKGQRKEKQVKEVTPPSDLCPNLSSGATTCQNAHESTSDGKVQVKSTEEPIQEHSRKQKQEPSTEGGKQRQEAETTSTEIPGPKKSKIHLKRVFKRKKKGQRKGKQFNEVTPPSDSCSNLSPGATTCQNAHESTSDGKVQVKSTEEPIQEHLRKQKQEPSTDGGQQRQEAETNSTEIAGVEIIDISHVTSLNTSTNLLTRVGVKEELFKFDDSPAITANKKEQRHKKKQKWFVVRFSKKTKKTHDSEACDDRSEKAKIETMSENEKRKELLEHSTTVTNLGSKAEKKKRGLKTLWKKAKKRKRGEKDSSSESDQAEGKLSDFQDDRPRHKKWKRKWPRLLKKGPKKSSSDTVPEPEVAVNKEQPKRTLEDLQREVTETQEIVRDIVEKKLAQRDEKLRDLTRVAENLEKAAEQFEKVSKKVRFKMWLRSRKWTVCTVSTVVVVLSLGAMVLCVIFV
ncbi:uncharacterized protein LOC144907921 [Branchiostoma floridae x Branchiostoma belcheri]